MGAWQIDPTDTAKWTGTEQESARQSVRIYKKCIRPLLKDVKVHHILPRPDGQHWDGMFYWNERVKRGTLYISRPDSEEQAHTVTLKGLSADAEYWVWSEDGSVPPGARKAVGV